MTPRGAVYVAGATGCTGAHIAQALLAGGAWDEVKVSYRLGRPFLKDRRLAYRRADLRRLEDCRRCVAGCAAAVLAAGNVTGAAATATSQARQLSDNLTMNMHLLQACAEEGVRRVVYIGSATAYQEAAVALREEDLDWNAEPPAAYRGIAWGMRFVEKLCRFWHESAGMETVVVRATNIFGPYAKFDPGTSHVIPALIRKAVDRQDPFEVWGSPEVTRDVVYAGDFAQAVAAILEKRDLKFDVFNVGSGAPVKVGDIVQWVLAAADHRPKEIRYGSANPAAARFRAFDTRHIREVLGWVPRTGIEEGIRQTVAWWRRNRKGWKR
ncbi:MAG: NAD-dependent epimerase/dehydratase family protein [Deltaproteobacteria bacterium]